MGRSHQGREGRCDFICPGHSKGHSLLEQQHRLLWGRGAPTRYRSRATTSVVAQPSSQSNSASFSLA